MDRGKDQLGTLGSGNHFVEVGYVHEIFDEELAAALGLFQDQVTAIVHTGSRGLGHQVCEDYIKVMLKAAAKYGIELPDRQLCCAPLNSAEAGNYLAAMAAAANFAFANRQMITHWVRESFEQVLQIGPRDLGLELVYDVGHNIAKIETHTVEGQPRRSSVSTARARPGPFRRTTRRCRRPIRRPGSRCSSPGTWGGTLSYWWGPKKPLPKLLAAPATGRGGR